VIKVLVVNNEPALLEAVEGSLTARGYVVRLAASGRGAIEAIVEDPPDVVVLGLDLPDVDGLEVCRRVREAIDVPIIAVFDDSHEHRKVESLEAGADDYVTKPFQMSDLVARVEVTVRDREMEVSPDESVFKVGDLVIDVARHEVAVAGATVALSPKEFAFLTLLARWPGRVVPHQTILREVWGPEYGSETNYLRVYASAIRKKLGDDPERPRVLSEPGVGYRLIDPLTESD
jgi:two-component system, OmpR family, KDP operon response regulator KdpE